MSIIQSIIFHKEFGLHNARHWLDVHGYKKTKVDETTHTFRFRQVDPVHLEMMLFHFRTKPFKHGYFVIAYPPE